MSDLILGADKALVFPAGDGVSHPVVFDLTSLVKAEARLVELQAVTALKAGELTYTFMTAWRDAATYAKRGAAHFRRAKRTLREVRARIVLDKVPDILKDKGLASSRSPAGSEDLRDSVVSLDADYQAAADRLEQVEAVVEYLDIKAEVFKMAYFAVDKLLDPHDRTKRDLSGGAGDDQPGAMTNEEKVEEFVERVTPTETTKNYGRGLGAPKY